MKSREIIGNDDPAVYYRILARRPRDNRRPITPEIREALACIIESLETIARHQQVLEQSLPDAANMDNELPAKSEHGS